MQKKLSGNLRYKALVYGWYNKGNIGDELFKDAFNKLFPDIDFTFVTHLNASLIKNTSIIFFGGGSFLDGKPEIHPDCLEDLKSKNIFYIGVGPETNIHPIHQELMKTAKFLAVRSDVNFDYIKSLNSKSIVIPDIVYSLYQESKNKVKNKSVLILPNISTVPNNSSEHWKHVHWEKFKLEFSQFLDSIVSEGYKISFLSMCENKTMNDDWAAIEITNNMKYRSNYILNFKFDKIESIINLMSDYDYIITQRYHGTILSEISKIPCLTIHHHDKLKKSFLNQGIFISYYESVKHNFYNEFKNLEKSTTKSIDIAIFDNLISTVNSLLKEIK